VTRELASEIDGLVRRQNDESATGADRSRAGGMSLIEKMMMWENLNPAKTPDPEGREQSDGLDEEGGQDNDSSDDDDEDDEILTSHAGSLLFSKYIHSSPAYDWFIANLQKQCSLKEDSMTECAMANICSTILAHLPQGRISKRRAPRTHSVTFRVPWAPIKARLRTENRFLSGSDGRICDIVAITFSGTQALACSVEKYVDKTWPFGGSVLVNILQRVADDCSLLHCGRLRSAMALSR
jgi:hypothetical protein